jgi:tetratricopeptide (TPR) repeat protein
MKKILVAAFILSAWALGAQTLAEAKKMFYNGNYSAAKEALNKIIASEKDPAKQAEAYFWIGESDFYNLKDENPTKALETAREAYNKGIAVYKESPHCQVGMGKLLLAADNTKEALKTFDAAIRDSRGMRNANGKKYKEGHPEVYMLIGDAYSNVKKPNFEQAVANYTRARDIEPTEGIYWLKLGDGNLAKGDAGAAMSAYESASSKDPKNADVLLKMARIWKQASKYDLAIENLKKGLAIDPGYAPLYGDLAEMYYRTGQYDKVAPTLEQYLPLVGNKDPYARLRFIKFLTYQVKDYDRAIKEGEDFAKNLPSAEFNSVYRWIAWAKVSKADTLVARNKNVLGDDAKMLYQEAKQASETLIKLLPADRTVDYDYEYAAKAAMKLQDFDAAKGYYAKVIEADATKACDIYTSIVQAYYEAKKFKEGLDAFDEKISKCEVKNKNTEYFYAMYYAYSLGAKDSLEYNRAVKYADKYIESYPNTVYGYYYKALSLGELDSDEPTWKAKETHEKLISVYEAKPDAASKPMVSAAYNYMGIYYGAQQDLVKAKEFFQKTLTVDPTNKRATDMIQQIDGASGTKGGGN